MRTRRIESGREGRETEKETERERKKTDSFLGAPNDPEPVLAMLKTNKKNT